MNLPAINGGVSLQSFINPCMSKGHFNHRLAQRKSYKINTDVVGKYL
jgi:hypothetical protein